MGGQVATLGVFDTLAREGGVLALVDIRAGVAIPCVALSTRAKVAAQGVCAIGENVARPIFALVVIGHVATFASIAIVTMALAVQTGAVFAFTTCRVTTIFCKITKRKISIKNISNLF